MFIHFFPQPFFFRKPLNLKQGLSKKWALIKLTLLYKFKKKLIVDIIQKSCNSIWIVKENLDLNPTSNLLQGKKKKEKWSSSPSISKLFDPLNHFVYFIFESKSIKSHTYTHVTKMRERGTFDEWKMVSRVEHKPKTLHLQSWLSRHY